jgi:RNA-directed DNA polymerase
MHYVFDAWMKRNHANKPWCRYADDGLVHCKTKMGAESVLEALHRRFSECGLTLHPDKTKIVYCKDDMRKGKHTEMKFDFLGFTFRRRLVINSKTKVAFVSFTPSVSNHLLKSMRSRIRKLGWRNRTELSLNEIAKAFNPTLQGWMNYYGSYNRSGMYAVWRHFNKTLVAWATKKFKGFGGSGTKAGRFLQAMAKRAPSLFSHWRSGMVGSFV